MITLELLANKEIPTWKVSDGKNNWFFNKKSISAFEDPKDAAKRLYLKLKGETK